METSQNEFLKGIFASINDLFANEIGPVAHILCEEVASEWEAEIHKRGQRPGLRNIPVYVHKLSKLIDDEKNRKAFLDSAFRIEALNLFNK